MFGAPGANSVLAVLFLVVRLSYLFVLGILAPRDLLSGYLNARAAQFR